MVAFQGKALFIHIICKVYNRLNKDQTQIVCYGLDYFLHKNHFSSSSFIKVIKLISISWKIILVDSRDDILLSIEDLHITVDYKCKTKHKTSFQFLNLFHIKQLCMP